MLSTEKRKQLYCCSSSFGHRSRVYGIKCNRFFPDLDSNVLWGTGEVDWNLKRIVFHPKMLIVTISGLFTSRPLWTLPNYSLFQKGKGKMKFGGAKSLTGEGHKGEGGSDSSQLMFKKFFLSRGKGNSPGSGQSWWYQVMWEISLSAFDFNAVKTNFWKG